MIDKLTRMARQLDALFTVAQALFNKVRKVYEVLRPFIGEWMQWKNLIPLSLVTPFNAWLSPEGQSLLEKMALSNLYMKMF